MIANQIIGKSFRGILDYLVQKVKNGVGKLIGSNMLGDDARSLAKEFGMIRALKPNVSRAVYHTSLSISPDEKLTDDQFQELAEQYLNAMGFANSQYLIYRHFDTEHPHIHLVANRIDLNGKVVSDKWNYHESEKIIRKLEKEYNLKEVISSEKVEEKAMSKGQIENFKKTGSIPIRTQLQILVKQSLQNSWSIKEFENEMFKAGANVMLHRNGQGNIFGISFELEGVKFKASQLGKGYSWNKIKTQLNDEQDKRIGSEESRRKDSDTRTASTKNTGNQHSGYQRAEDSNNTSPKDFGKPDNRNQARGNQVGSSPYSTQENARFGGEATASDGLFNRENEEELISNEMEDFPNSDNDWDSNRNRLFSGNTNLSEDDVEDEDEIAKRRKRKKRIKR